MESHQKYAIGLFIIVVSISILKNGYEEALVDAIILAAFLAPILFHRVIAYFSGFGFPEYFAKDFGSENRPRPYALFFWVLFIIACAFILFGWSFY